MVWFVLSIAVAATLEVGPTQTYPTVSDAVTAAADGDTIRVEPGTYVEWIRVDRDLTIEGTGPGVVLRADGLADDVIVVEGASLTLRDVEVDGDGVAACIDGTFDVGDITILGAVVARCDGVGVDGGVYGRILVRDSAFFDIDGVGVQSADPLIVLDSTFENTGAGVVLSGDDRVEGCTFRNNGGGVSSTSFTAGGRPRIVGNTFQANGIAVTAFGSNKDGGSIALIRGNLFNGNDAGIWSRNDRNFLCGYYGCPPQEVSRLPVVQNTFVDQDLALDIGSGMIVATIDNVFAHNDRAVRGIWGTIYPGDIEPELIESHNLWFDNATDVEWTLGTTPVTPPALGPTSLLGVDPQFVSFTDNGQWLDDDLSPQAGSPLIDAGLPLLVDPDGSVSDIGSHPFVP